MPGIHYLTGEQIRAARAITRIDQAELARLSGVSLETIKRLERIHGQVDANIRTLNRILDAFLSLSVTLESSEEGAIGVLMRRGGAVRGASAAMAERSVRPGEGQTLQRLIYYNTATPEILNRLKSALKDIQMEMAQRNAEIGVTGLLFSRNGRFLHVMEGPRNAVQMMYGAISVDPRYSVPCLLQNCESPRRKFSDWNLCCGVFESDEQVFGSEPSIQGRFDPGKLSPAAALGLLTVARDMVGEPPRCGLDRANGCSLADQCLDRSCATTRATSVQNC